MAIDIDSLVSSPGTDLEPVELGKKALEHAVGLLVLGSVEGADPEVRQKLSLAMILAADLVVPDPGKDKIQMISDAKSRVIQRLIGVEPDLAESIAHRRMNLKSVRKKWQGLVRMAYSTVVIDQTPRGSLEVPEIQRAILEHRLDFHLPEDTTAAA